MKDHTELFVYKASYDLLLSIFQITKNFSKEYKYTVGEQLKNETIEITKCLFKANISKDKEAIKYSLEKASEHLEVIRLLFRVMKDLKQLNLEKFIQINEVIESISNQLNTWKFAQNK